MQYLKDKQHYIDLCDLHTIEECLRMYNNLNEAIYEKRHELTDMSDEEFDSNTLKLVSIHVNVIKGERYRNKALKIQEWIDEDGERQYKYDKTLPPSGIYCKYCGGTTKVIYKDLHDAYDKNPKMMFMFECTKCNKRACYFEYGQEWIYKKDLCPNCHIELYRKVKRRGNIIKTLYSCKKCGYENEDEFRLSDSTDDKKWEEKQANDRKLLAQYRNIFCLDDINGPEYINQMDSIRNFMKDWQEKQNKENDPIYQKVRKLKRLSVLDLEKLLSKRLAKENYIRFSLDKPEIGKYVIVSFTVLNNAERNEYDTVQNLKRLINRTLKDTNWRLMSEGISSRLGTLTGRLKGYEN